jgi:hypothetical protein
MYDTTMGGVGASPPDGSRRRTWSGRPNQAEVAGTGGCVRESDANRPSVAGPAQRNNNKRSRRSAFPDRCACNKAHVLTLPVCVTQCVLWKIRHQAYPSTHLCQTRARSFQSWSALNRVRRWTAPIHRLLQPSSPRPRHHRST